VSRRTALISIALVLLSCTSERPSPSEPAPASVVIETRRGRVQVSVRVADTGPEQFRGLMGQRSLAPDAGMVFTYTNPTVTPFWMKDTTIPLSIAFWNERGEIVDMLDMEPCTSEPCPLYSANTSFVGALEVNQGFFDRHEVAVGDTVELKPRP
jgi:uncharacterized membrane protein (UPF0127 family)